MIIKHKALRVDNQKEIEGFFVEENSQSLIVNETNERFLVEKESVRPSITNSENGLFWISDIIFSDNLTSEESSKFLWILKKAQRKL